MEKQQRVGTGHDMAGDLQAPFTEICCSASSTSKHTADFDAAFQKMQKLDCSTAFVLQERDNTESGPIHDEYEMR